MATTADLGAPAGATSDRPSVGVGIVTGVVCAAVAVGVAHLVAGIVRPEASPVVSVGEAAIDAAPAWLKAFAIRTFGSNDKEALIVGILVVLSVIAALLGIAAMRRPVIGYAGLAGFGLLGVIASVTRPDASGVDALPSIAGALAGATMLRAFLATRSAAPRDEPPAPGGVDRRRFFATAGAGAVAAIAAGGIGRAFAQRFEADASRAAVDLPVSPSPLRPPPGTDLRVPGLSPFLTPNADFYRVDTALLVPSVRAEGWTLRVHGMVEHELTLTYAQLLDRPLVERDVTLACVSNEVGGGYVGNARWLGTPLRDLLDEAGPSPDADQVVSRSADGFTAGTPTAVLTDGRDALLAVAMNGEPLPLEHGFPVRMVVPGLYGYVSATKWVVDLELTTFEAFDAYWIQRGWAQQAPIKTQSRIDTPRVGETLRAGPVTVAGVAWAQHRGISAVELRVDGGAWIPAQLAAEDTVDTWRQWLVRWDATGGSHRLQVRAMDGDGMVQTDRVAPPFPDGATGYHTIGVEVG